MIRNEPDDPDNALLANAEEATRQAVARLAVRPQIPQQRLLEDVEQATQRQQPRGGSALRAPGEKVSDT